MRRGDWVGDLGCWGGDGVAPWGNRGVGVTRMPRRPRGHATGGGLGSGSGEAATQMLERGDGEAPWGGPGCGLGEGVTQMLGRLWGRTMGGRGASPR